MTRWPRAFSSEPASAAAETTPMPRRAGICLLHRVLVDVACLGLELDRPRQGRRRRREAGLHRRPHRADDLVEEGVDLRLAAAGNRRFVGHGELGDRDIVALRVGDDFLHRFIGIFRRVLLRRRVALPLDEAAADRIIFLLQQAPCRRPSAWRSWCWRGGSRPWARRR